MVFIIMQNSDLEKLLDAIKDIHTTIRRFGVYFVVLSLLPILWAIFVFMIMGATLGGLFGGVAKGVSAQAESRSFKAPPMTTSSQVQNDTQELLQTIADLQEQLSENAAQPKTRGFNAGPSAPPKFPSGVRFVPDPSNPKGYRAVNDGN